MKTLSSLSLLACCCLALLSFPAFAAEAAEPAAEAAAEPAVAVEPGDAQSDCRTSAVLFGDSALEDPIALAGCSITVECDDGSMVSCTGDSTCTTSGTNNRCVTCDGVQEGCCQKTCCETCQEQRENCLQSCGPFGFPPDCDACDTAYNICIGNCTGGC